MASTVVLFAALLVGSSAGAQSSSAKFYTDLKNAEAKVPLPPLSATVLVGTFNVASGVFTPAIPGTQATKDVATTPQGKPVVVGPNDFESSVSVPARTVTLSFHFSNRGTTACTLGVAGQTTSVTQTSVSIGIGSADRAGWSIACGAKAAVGGVTVKHDVAGAGGFVVAAIPVSVLYEPPMDRRKLNTATYRVTATLGNAISWEFEASSSSTTPTEPSAFAGVNEFTAKAGLLATGLSKVNNPYAQAASGVLSAIAGGLGSATAANTTGTTATAAGALVVEAGQGYSFTSAAKAGPGHGDVIVYLRNVRVAWLAENEGAITLALIGWDAMAEKSVDTLTAELATLESQPPGTRGPVTGLDAVTIRGLLAADPFTPQGRASNVPKVPGVAMPVKPHVAVPVELPPPHVAPGPAPAATVVLDPERFAYEETFELNAVQAQYTVTHKSEASTARSSTRVRSNTEEYSEGFLSFLGVGVDETKTLTVSQRSTASEEYRDGREVQAEVALFAEADENYAVSVYYDRVFGSFAFTQEAVGQVRVTGLLLAADGAPRPKERIVLRAANRTFVTTTDAKGRYTFRSSKIPAGKATIVTGSRSWSVDVKPAAPTTFDVRL